MPGADVEIPAVSAAGDDRAFEAPLRERAARVRATILHGVHPPVGAKQTDVDAIHAYA